MLTDEFLFDEQIFYLEQRELFLRFLDPIGGIYFLIDFVRGEIAEIEVLQLVPGYYLILIGIAYFFLFSMNFLFLNLPIDFDNRKDYGTKNIRKLNLLIIKKIGFSFFCVVLFFGLFLILPISLDSFPAYSEKNIENLWLFQDVVGLEIFLLNILIWLSQTPLFFFMRKTTETYVPLSIYLDKFYIFLLLIASGILTPTVDGYTQLSFFFSLLLSLILIINQFDKRFETKSIYSYFLGF
jgi:hypothetical protein